jgi:hypothetical protein
VLWARSTLAAQRVEDQAIGGLRGEGREIGRKEAQVRLFLIIYPFLISDRFNGEMLASHIALKVPGKFMQGFVRHDEGAAELLK